MKQRQDLDGLSEPHIIRETGPELEPAEAAHPAKALELIGSELGAEPLADRGFTRQSTLHEGAMLAGRRINGQATLRVE